MYVPSMKGRSVGKALWKVKTTLLAPLAATLERCCHSPLPSASG
jgi:hypothetical protein